MKIVERTEVSAIIGTGKGQRGIRWDKKQSSLLIMQAITDQNRLVETIFTWAEALELRDALDQYLKDAS